MKPRRVISLANKSDTIGPPGVRTRPLRGDSLPHNNVGASVPLVRRLHRRCCTSGTARAYTNPRLYTAVESPAELEFSGLKNYCAGVAAARTGAGSYQKTAPFEIGGKV